MSNGQFSTKLLLNLAGRCSVFVLSLLVVVACEDHRDKPDEPLLFRVSTYNEPGVGSVNSHLIETRQGIIVVDMQRSVASANRVVAQLKAMNKPVLALILTHEHPDHMGGWQAFARAFPGVPFYLSQAARDAIIADKFGFQQLSEQASGDNFSEGVPVPTGIVRDGESYELGGLQFVVDEIGAGEAEGLTMLYVPAVRTLFSTDLIANRMTPFLIEGRTTAWLRQLDAVEAAYGGAETIYPGHGQPGTVAALVANQREYLRYFRQLITAQLQQNRNAIPPAAKQAIINAVEARYPGYLPVAELPMLLEKNIDAVAQELR